MRRLLYRHRNAEWVACLFFFSEWEKWRHTSRLLLDRYGVSGGGPGL